MAPTTWGVVTGSGNPLWMNCVSGRDITHEVGASLTTRRDMVHKVDPISRQEVLDLSEDFPHVVRRS